jgi:hypothetical protein
MLHVTNLQLNQSYKHTANPCHKLATTSLTSMQQAYTCHKLAATNHISIQANTWCSLYVCESSYSKLVTCDELFQVCNVCLLYACVIGFCKFVTCVHCMFVRVVTASLWHAMSCFKFVMCVCYMLVWLVSAILQASIKHIYKLTVSNITGKHQTHVTSLLQLLSQTYSEHMSQTCRNQSHKHIANTHYKLGL